MNNNIHEKDQLLRQMISDMGKVMVAFSGGVDSSFLLKRAKEELGDQVLAVVVDSELFRKQEFDSAVHLAKELGVKVHKTEIKELENSLIVKNTPDSWYYSKKMLYQHLTNIAEDLEYPYILDGMIMDDLDDFRPGLKARTEAGVRSLLQEAGMYKDEIRELAKESGLSVWNKTASCSLASRIPYGVSLSHKKIHQVNEAELFLMGLGFDPVRVRHHNNIARIEIDLISMTAFINNQKTIHDKIISLGFSYATLDLKGYRTGSMNEVLEENSKVLSI